MSFAFRPLPLRGLILVEPRVTRDERGFFMETYKRSEFASHGIDVTFVQDNHSSSTLAVLRGLHWQVAPHEQGKLVRVIEGAVWDVAVDLRPDSPTRLRWYGLELSGDNALMLYIPPGFAHGFVTLTDHAHFTYKCTSEYDPSCERGCRWDDPTLAIAWPLTQVHVSGRDAALPPLRART